jgi:hypothetical protein
MRTSSDAPSGKVMCCVAPVLAAHVDRAAPAPAAKDLRENVVVGKVGKAGVVGILRAGVGEITVILPLLRPLGAGRVDLAAIEAGALFFVAEKIVRAGDLLETLLGLLVARIKVRVQLLRQRPIGFLDVALGSVLFYPQDFIGIGSQDRLLVIRLQRAGSQAAIMAAAVRSRRRASCGRRRYPNVVTQK